ncbi:hypothetical protein ScPMuIL_006382 [Solemya velum]
MSSGESDIIPVPNMEDIPMHSTPIKEGPIPSLLNHRHATHRPHPQGHVRADGDIKHNSPTHHGRRNHSIEQERAVSSLQHAAFQSPKHSPRTMQQSARKQLTTSDLETSTLCKQRQEIQLLVCELKERDRELNDMVTSHHQQLVAWDQDRQRLLSLEQKMSRYENELVTRTKQLKKALSQLKAVKYDHQSQNSTLETTQDHLARLTVENSQQSLQLQSWEEKNKQLNTSIREMSSRVGQLEAREGELTTMLRLREKDINIASGEIQELNGKLKKFEVQCRASREREAAAVKETQVWAEKYERSKTELDLITEQLQKKTAELESKLGEMRRARHHISIIQEDNSNKDTAKDELITSLKGKQLRTEEQLRSMRELYERQQREVAMLQLNLVASEETIARQQASLEDYSSLKSSGCSRLMSHLSPNNSAENSPILANDTGSDKRMTNENPPNKKSPNSPRHRTDTRVVRFPVSRARLEKDNIENQKELSFNNSNSNAMEQIPGENIASQQSIQEPQFFWKSEMKQDVHPLQGNVESRTDYSQECQTLPPNSDKNVYDRSHERLPSMIQGVNLSSGDSVVNGNELSNRVTWRHSLGSGEIDPSSLQHRENIPHFITTRSKADSHMTDSFTQETTGANSRPSSSSSHGLCEKGEMVAPVEKTDQPVMIHNDKVTNEHQNGFCTPPRHGPEGEAGELDQYKELRASFEDRLSVFLDEVIDEGREEDIDFKFMRQIEASPTSKLQKLLFESRVMIESLEKTASPPSHPPEKIQPSQNGGRQSDKQTDST